MLEKDIELLIMCLKEYIKDIDGEKFKEIFLGYVEYMARNYGQDCILDEYDIDSEEIKKINDTKYIINGRMTVTDFCDYFNIDDFAEDALTHFSLLPE